MPRSLKLHAFAVLILSVLFYLFFEVSKHNPVLSAVNVFGDDPYDAVGSFGIQAAALLAVLSGVRAFRPYSAFTVSERRRVLLVRTLMMSVLAVGITLVGDAIAMLRHPSVWIGSDGGRLLAGLLVGMVALTAMAGWLIYRDIQPMALRSVSGVWRRSAIISTVAAAILALYPEGLRQSLSGELFTVLVGILLLFVPMWALGTALVPHHEATPCDAATASRFPLYKYRWSLIALAGIFIGFGLALGELQVQKSWPRFTSHVVFVILVFVCLEAAGVLIGYGFLRRPLGFTLQQPPDRIS